MRVALQRVIRSGIEKFSRDKSSSGAALFVMVIILTIVSSLFFLQGTSTFLIATLQESVDISTYLKDTAQEEDIMVLQEELKSVPEVKDVVYVTKEEALKQFVETHKQDEVILQSLDVVGTNPLLASLNIKAFHASQYPVISEFLENTASSSIISDVDYHDRAPVIERLEKLSIGIQSGVFLITLLVAFIAALVAFNTIRLTIYSSRDEIEIMRLVGASNWFIRGPFLVQGIIVGILATLITTLLLFPFTLFLSFRLQTFVPGFDLFQYFTGNLFLLLLLQFGVGIGLGIISSMIAIRKYLKV
tara:strand:- start:5170 stop:6078 length:909 start_codon:yes stop_codon:yes gene_type:complete